MKISLMLVGLGLAGSVAVFCLVYAFRMAERLVN